MSANRQLEIVALLGAEVVQAAVVHFELLLVCRTDEPTPRAAHLLVESAWRLRSPDGRVITGSADPWRDDVDPLGAGTAPSRAHRGLLSVFASDVTRPRRIAATERAPWGDLRLTFDSGHVLEVLADGLPDGGEAYWRADLPDVGVIAEGVRGFDEDDEPPHPLFAPRGGDRLRELRSDGTQIAIGALRVRLRYASVTPYATRGLRHGPALDAATWLYDLWVDGRRAGFAYRGSVVDRLDDLCARIDPSLVRGLVLDVVPGRADRVDAHLPPLLAALPLWVVVIVLHQGVAPDDAHRVVAHLDAAGIARRYHHALHRPTAWATHLGDATPRASWGEG